MKTLFLFLLSVQMLLVAGNGWSMELEKEIYCTTPNEEKAFVLKEHTIVFQNMNDEAAPARKVASAKIIQTKIQDKGFTKTTNFERNAFKVKIDNTEAFNEANDFITIASPEGHVLTYPIKCQAI